MQREDTVAWKRLFESGYETEKKCAGRVSNKKGLLFET